MKVCLIPPKNYLHYADYGDMYFIVPQNADPSFFASRRKYKILDNGTYEQGQPLDVDSLLAMAKTLQVDEIILPDVMLNKNRTVELIEGFLGTVKKTFVYAAVPQGKNLREWIECYVEFSKRPEIDVLCIPIWLQKLHGMRPGVVYYLQKKKLWSHTKDHHLIGLDSLGELYCYGSWIRSVDTSLPFSVAQRGLLSFLEPSGILRVDLQFASLDEDFVFLNIQNLLEAAKYA